MTKKFLFDSDGRYTYGFAPSGLFTLVNREGEPLYDEAIPLYRKLFSHLVWIFLWIVVISTTNLLFSQILLINRIFMSLIFFHLFLIGYRLTTLLLKGGFRPIFFPPLWIRLTRELQRGKGIELLKKHNLHEHPGMLVNLALVQFNREHVSDGRQTLSHALALCPDHPDIQQIYAHMIS